MEAQSASEASRLAVVSEHGLRAEGARATGSVCLVEFCSLVSITGEG